MSLSKRNAAIVYSIIIAIAICGLTPKSNADIIHESANMGLANQWPPDYEIFDTQFLGSRFEITETTEITAIGGHLGSKYQELHIFGAIVNLDNNVDFPHNTYWQNDLVEWTYLRPPSQSADIRTPLNVILQPGWYGLIFGAGEFGLTNNAIAFMPGGGQTRYPGSSYFHWNGVAEIWVNTALPYGDPRFVVEGHAVIPPVEIYGTKFNDVDGDGFYDPSEPNMPGWEIYLDLNGNGIYDTSEPNAITDPNGMYRFTDLDTPATYRVREVDRDGWTQTLPGASEDNEYVLYVEPNNIYGPYDFGNTVWNGLTQTLYPIADTYVKSTEPDTNFGTSNSVTVGKSSSTGAIYRSFLKFDMTEIPKGYRIVSAQLQLQANFLPFANVEIGAWRTSESWDESEITWNDQKSGYDTLPADTFIAVMDDNTWDVTQDADDTYCYERDLSILLQSTDENHPYYVGFWSSELPVPDDIPRLVVQYEPMFGGGKGTVDDPFQIWTDEQMNTIGLYEGRWDRHYRLMDDISMSGYTGSNYNQIGRWSSSPANRALFRGVFDGDGHTISDFQAGALFDYVNLGRIQQLGLIAPNVSGDGALVNRLEWGDVAQCWVQGGSVNGGSSVGGLVGYLWLSNMSGCWSSAAVSGTDDVGGLIGTSNSLGHIENCYASGSVSGQDSVGGFIGYAGESIIVNCYSTGLVSGTSEVGGFCGHAENLLLPPDVAIGCFWDTTSSNQAGSAVGTPLATTAMQNQATFTTAGWDFVGETANGRNNDWAMPVGGGYPVLWYQLSTAPPLPGFAGGNGTAGNPYLIATVEQLNSIGHNTRLLDQHFRLINDLDLSDQPFAMIADGPYAFMGSFDGNSHVIKNVNLSIPSYYCNIGFVGYNYGGSIYDLTLQKVSVVAEYARNVGSLIGMNRSGLVQNCHSLNVDVTGLWTVGGLVASNYWHSTIAECSVIGSVAESSDISILSSGVGGIVGENIYWSKIETSGFVGDIAGDDFLGGLVGSDAIYSQLIDCYATGTINSTEGYVGGLAGRTIGSEITRCYAACEITAPAEETRIGAMAGHEQSGTYTDCFWDDQINGALPGFGYTNSRTVLIDTVGETTENMKTMTTYTSQGWDFGNVWRICDGMSYPRIKLHPKLAGDFVCPEGVEFADLVLLTEEWLAAVPLPSVDIAPDGAPDGKANLPDYSIIAENWLLGVD